jgi:molybdenum cofactor cytidylyltransferase
MIAARDSGVRNNMSRQRSLPGVWSVVLAAGGARRFGRNKLLVRAGAETLVVRAARRAISISGARSIVVLGADASLLSAELAGLPVCIVVNRRWREGMAGSLQAGIGALPTSARAALVTLADQYAIGTSELWQLARVWARNPRVAAAASAAGGPGAPAILPRSDRGARNLLRDPDRLVTVVDLPAGALDLDERNDLRCFKRLRRRLP